MGFFRTREIGRSIFAKGCYIETQDVLQICYSIDSVHSARVETANCSPGVKGSI